MPIASKTNKKTMLMEGNSLKLDSIYIGDDIEWSVVAAKEVPLLIILK